MDNPQGPFIVAGNRAYLIGDMNGTFPAYGEHIPGEMTGLWQHPHKLMQSMDLGWALPGSEPQWPLSDRFHRGPWHVDQHFLLSRNVEANRRMWVPDDQPGVMIELTLSNRGESSVEMDIVLGLVSDLHPGWLDESPRGHDTASPIAGGVLFRNDVSPSGVACLAESAAQEVILHDRELAKRAPSGSKMALIRHTLKIVPGQPVCLRYWIVGQDASTNPWVFPAEFEQWRAAKQARYQRLDLLSQLSLPDEQLMQAAQWMKYQTDWLIRSVPGFGLGLGAGVPEYPWWFACDNHYALKGLLTFGQHEWVEQTLTLLKDVSWQTNRNGRIVHEMSTTGKVFNPGNAQESPQFCAMVWETYLWTGDKAWLQSMYPAVVQAMQWVSQLDTTARDLAPGYGIIEIEDLNLRMIDTAVYTYTGLVAYAEMARIFEGADCAQALSQRAARLKSRLLELYWIDEEGLFGDFLAQPSEVESRAGKWALRALNQGNPEAAKRYRQLPAFGRGPGESLYLMKNWIIATPMETGIAPDAWANRALERMRLGSEFHGPYGLYLSGTDQSEMMTISTGVQAVAEIQYGHADFALRWMKDIAKTQDVRSPGTISEMSPDYGCFVQAWTAYGLWYPLVTGFFGIHPKASERSCYVNPCMPSHWHQAKLAQVRMGSNHIDCAFTRNDQEMCRVSTREPWRITTGSQWEVVDIHGGYVDSSAIDLQSPGAWVELRKNVKKAP